MPLVSQDSIETGTAPGLDSKKGDKNNQLVIETTQEPSDDFVSEAGMGFATDHENFKLRAHYEFIYDPYSPEGSISKRTKSGKKSVYQMGSRHIDRIHHGNINLAFDLGKKDELLLTNSFSYTDHDEDELTRQKGFHRNFRQNDKSYRYGFSQVWDHRFNDSVSLKIGGYEVFKREKTRSKLRFSDNNRRGQRVKSDIPIFVGSADYKNKNQWGKTSAGVKFHHARVKAENLDFDPEISFSSLFRYNEDVIAEYIAHEINLGGYRNLEVGLSLESSFINPKNSVSSPTGKSGEKQRFTNFLYHVDYSWRNKAHWDFALGFQKTMERPDFKRLNPFKKITSYTLGHRGNPNLKPAKSYGLDFDMEKNSWKFYAQAGYAKDKVTTFYALDQGEIIETGRNFQGLYKADAGINYAKRFFNGVWETKNNLDLRFRYFKDKTYDLGSGAPRFTWMTHNAIRFLETWRFAIDFTIHSKGKDGLMERHGYSKLDLSLYKEVSDQFTILVFAEDLLQNDRYWENTQLPDYSFEPDIYRDSHTFGVKLRYTILGRNYQEPKFENQGGGIRERL